MIYAILRQWVTTKSPQTYSDLSHSYQARTGDWFEPHGSWDKPLGELNNHLARFGAPALSALVVLKNANEPGKLFWGCAPNVPPRPPTETERLAEWNRIVDEVCNYSWPEVLPR